MSRGIIIFGAPGAGSSTLGKALARRLNFLYLDLDDYFWRWDTKIPYTLFRTNEETYKLVMDDIAKSRHFILSGSIGESNRKMYEPLLDLAVFITAPSGIRVDRLRSRTFSNFGERVLEGGDMYAQNNRFIESAANYETNGRLKQHEQWIEELPCRVLCVDGTKDVFENVERITEQYLSMLSQTPH